MFLFSVNIYMDLLSYSQRMCRIQASLVSLRISYFHTIIQVGIFSDSHQAVMAFQLLHKCNIATMCTVLYIAIVCSLESAPNISYKSDLSDRNLPCNLNSSLRSLLTLEESHLNLLLKIYNVVTFHEFKIHQIVSCI